MMIGAVVASDSLLSGGLEDHTVTAEAVDGPCRADAASLALWYVEE